MNKTQQTGYLVVFIYLVLSAFATSVCQLLMLVGQGLTPSIWFQFGLGIAFMVAFAVSALVAVWTFLKNVFILGKSRTVKQIKPFCEEEPIGLNQMQKKLMDLSAKYVSLFILASLSSVISMFSGFYESATDLRISLFLVPIDCSFNLLCIYLQYAFAEKHYNKYCGKLDWYCKRMMTAGWVQSIHTMRRKEFDLKTHVQNQSRKDSQVGPKSDYTKRKAMPTRLSLQIRECRPQQKPSRVQRGGPWNPDIPPCINEEPTDGIDSDVLSPMSVQCNPY